jgi:hypothetical protein
MVHFEFFRKFAEIIVSKGAPSVSIKLVANLPPVSTTPAANNGNNIRLLVLKVNLKGKKYVYVN